LRELGYRVIEAKDGEHALRRAALHEGRIDLLLTDVVMPKLGGWALYERLSVVRPELRVVFMSGYADGRLDQDELMRIGAAFVAKPFTAGALTRTVRMTLDLERGEPNAYHPGRLGPLRRAPRRAPLQHDRPCPPEPPRLRAGPPPRMRRPLE